MVNSTKTAHTHYHNYIWSPIRLIYEAVPTLAKIIGWRYTVNNLFLQTTVLAAGNYFIYNTKREVTRIVSNIISEQYNNLSCAYNEDNTCSNRAEVWDKFEDAFLPIAPLVIYSMALMTMQSIANHYLQKSLAHKLEDSIMERKLTDQVAYSMSSDSKMKPILLHISDDVEKFGQANLLMTNFLTVAQNAFMLLHDLVKISSFIQVCGPIVIPDLAFYSLAYGLGTNLVNQGLGAYKIKLSTELNQAKNELKLIEAHTNENTKVVTEKEGKVYAFKQQHDLAQKTREIDKEISKLGEAQKAWQLLHSNIYSIGKFYAFGSKLFDGSLAHEHRWMAIDIFARIDPVFAWAGINDDQIIKVLASAEHLNEFIENYSTVRSTASKICYTDHANINLTLTAVGLSAGEKNLLKDSSYDFEMGKRYLLDGGSGTGKSMLLSKINGLIDADGLTSVGTISIPKDKKVRLLPQTDYFPKSATLRDVLYYPDFSPASAEERALFMAKAIDLLMEMNFCKNRSEVEELLDVKKDWYTRLSGGEQKKVQLVAEIMKNPDILMLDESLNGMDAASRAATLNLIKRELPDALILAVDHHGMKDGDFYDKSLSFDNQELKEVELQSGASRSR